MKSPKRRSACLFGVKKNGSCARKVGRKSSRAASRNMKSRSARRAHKPRPRGSTPCLFGVKKNSACKRKAGRKSKSAIRRNRRSRSMRHATPKRSHKRKSVAKRSHKRKSAVKKSRAPSKKSSRAMTVSSTPSCQTPSDSNCRFGRKKNGSCSRKIGRRSKSANRRNARSRALRHAPKARPRGSTPCLFGVKKNGACSRKIGRRSKSAIKRNRHARVMRRLPVCGRGMDDSHSGGSSSNKVKGVVLSANKKQVVGLLTYEGKVEAVQPFAVPAIMPPTLPVVNVKPEVLAEIAKVEAVGEKVGNVKPAPTGHVAQMIELFDENLIKCREAGGMWDAKGKKCVMPNSDEDLERRMRNLSGGTRRASVQLAESEYVANFQQVVLSPDEKQIIAVVDHGEVMKLSKPIDAPVAVPEEAQAHPSKDEMKHALVVATPSIADVLSAVRECRESGGKWDKKSNTCKPALVVLSEDKTEVVAVVTSEGQVQALAVPIPTPPALPPAAVAHPPSSIMREIAKVEESGVPSAHVTIAPMSMSEVLAAVRTCAENGGKWDKKAQKCVMEKVILNSDKTEIIGVQEPSGAIAALANPIPVPPNAPPLPPMMVAKVSSSVERKLVQVEELGQPVEGIAIVAPPSGGRGGLLDAIKAGKQLKKVSSGSAGCGEGEVWKDGRCMKTASGSLLGEIQGGVKLRKASDRGSNKSSDSGRSSPEMERLLARRGRIAPEEDDDEGEWN